MRMTRNFQYCSCKVCLCKFECRQKLLYNYESALSRRNVKFNGRCVTMKNNKETGCCSSNSVVSFVVYSLFNLILLFQRPYDSFESAIRLNGCVIPCVSACKCAKKLSHELPGNFCFVRHDHQHAIQS